MKTLLLFTCLLLGPFAFGNEQMSDKNHHRSVRESHQSGIVGEVSLSICPVIGPGGCVVTSYRATISIFNDHGRLIEEVITDDEGLFSVAKGIIFRSNSSKLGSFHLHLFRYSPDAPS